MLVFGLVLLWVGSSMFNARSGRLYFVIFATNKMNPTFCLALRGENSYY